MGISSLGYLGYLGFRVHVPNNWVLRAFGNRTYSTEFG